jgi:Fe2+ or Zn2+ uptake regulation protein
MRYSRQRELILEIIMGTDSHPAADWVFQQARKQIPEISLGTVYRNLKRLATNGNVRTINDGTVVRYDWDQEPHDHLKCKICGDLMDVHLLEEDIRKSVREKYNFEVDDVEMTIIGTCNKHNTIMEEK